MAERAFLYAFEIFGQTFLFAMQAKSEFDSAPRTNLLSWSRDGEGTDSCDAAPAERPMWRLGLLGGMLFNAYADYAISCCAAVALLCWQ